MNTLLHKIKKTTLSQATLCGFAMGLLPLNAHAQGWPSQYQGVMLQGFYWDSFEASQWTKLESQADELAPYFKLIWVPQSAYCGGKSMGYNDLYWFNNYNSSFGTEKELRSMISTFKKMGIGTIADVVINHRGTIAKWFDFPEETYKGTTYKMTSTDVCAGDDKGKAAEEAKKEGVSLSANYDTGEDWDGMRDLDHNSANVQNCVKAYLDLLLNDLGYAGFRYDMVKGYAGRFTGIYNQAANPTYSVGEYFDGNKTSVINWLKATKVDDKVMSAAFDFPIRYSVRDAANKGDWSILAKGGLATDVTYKRYAVTFIENHDTEKRSDSEQDPIRKDTLAANAYLLAMPGTPCVFYKHWIDYKDEIKNMILLRNIAGIHNESNWSCTENSSSRYVVTTTGANMKLRAAVGTTANSYTPSDDGWALAAEGYHWSYFLPTSAETVFPSLPSGAYYNNPVVTLRAISTSKDAQIVYTTDGTDPTTTSTKVANATKITLPYGKCTLKAALLTNGKVGTVVTRSYDMRQFTSYNISVYVNTENVGWNNCYFWTWGGDDSHAPANKNWPGDNVTTTIEQNGKKWYSKSFKINTPTDYVSFVFAQSQSVQTVDVSGITKNVYLEIQNQKDSQGHYLVKDVTTEQPTAIIDITANNTTTTTVASLDGRTVRHFNHVVSTTEAVNGLAAGIYVVNGKKILVR